MFSRAVIVVFALVFVLGAAACGGDDDRSNAGEGATVTTSATETGTATTAETRTSETETDGANGSPGSSSDESSSTTGSTVQLPVDRVLFKSPDNAVFCGLRRAGGRDLMSCWAAPSGYTVRLTPRGGAPRGGVVTRNKGVRPPRASAIRVLRNRQRFRRGPYKCNVDRNVVRCENAARHGFQLGRSVAFRF